MPRSTPSQRRRLRNGSGRVPTLAQRIAAARDTRSSSPIIPEAQNSTSSLLSRLSDPIPEEPEKSPYLVEGHLRASEYERRKNERRCLYCGSENHFYRSCEHPKSSAALKKSTLEQDLDNSAEARRAALDWSPSAGNA